MRTKRPTVGGDPYGRPRLLTLAAAHGALFALFLAAFIDARRRGQTDMSSGGAFLHVSLYVGWFAAALIVFWWRPRACAVEEQGRKVLRVSSARKVALSIYTAPVLTLLADPAHRANPVPVVILLSLVVLALHLVSSSAYRVDAQGVARVSGYPRRRVEWADVVTVRVGKGGVVLGPREGRPLSIWNRWLDGWPEFASELLARLPSAALADEATRQILVDQANLFRSPRSSDSEQAPRRIGRMMVHAPREETAMRDASPWARAVMICVIGCIGIGVAFLAMVATRSVWPMVAALAIAVGMIVMTWPIRCPRCGTHITEHRLRGPSGGATYYSLPNRACSRCGHRLDRGQAGQDRQESR